MRSRWNDADAAAAVERWGGRYGPDLALRVYTSRLIGADTNLVLHGGGNTSVKIPVTTIFGDEIVAVFVKGSGSDLRAIEPEGFTPLNRAGLARLRSLEALPEDEMAHQLRIHQLRAAAPAPSVETLVHAFVAQRFVDHSHPSPLLCLSNQPGGVDLLREAVGEEIPILAYTRPGFPLAQEVARVLEAHPDAAGVAVAKHGLFTFGDDARTAYERHLRIVERCEQFLAARRPKRVLTPQYRLEAPAAELAARVAPVLRGLVVERCGSDDGQWRRFVIDWRGEEDVLAFVNSAEAAALAATGPLTPDYVVRTKPFALYVAGPRWDDAGGLRQQLRQAVEEFGRRYQAYVGAYRRPADGSTASLDALPRVAFLPGAGVFGLGRSKQEARIAADITVHGLPVKAVAHAMGGYESASAAHLCEMEYWSLQQAKFGRPAERPLERQVVLITGAGGAVGYGIARVCAEAGAHVVLTDIDSARLAHVAERIEQAHGTGTARAIAMNVTDPASVRAGFAEACRCYGGVDVVVANAGVAHVAPVAELSPGDLARVMAVNFTGTFLTIQEGVRVLRAQGLGGNIVINSSKNVFGPGKDFGAYSASKAAGHQLGKVSAIELAAEGIRVNMINADAIFAEDDVPSGLWATVGPERARSRGLNLEELPDYYRDRNLLRARVTARHVGNAVVFFASNRTPTTGATLPVDGGVVEAFPR